MTTKQSTVQPKEPTSQETAENAAHAAQRAPAPVRTREQFPKPVEAPPEPPQIHVNALDTSDGLPRVMLVQVSTPDGPRYLAQRWNTSWSGAMAIHAGSATSVYAAMAEELLAVQE